jgi:group I intron endonuclease
MIVYKIENIINKKVYIGKTSKDLITRIKQHLKSCKRDNSIFHKAIIKYGIENFCISELENNIFSEEDLNQKEIYYIKLYNSHHINGHGYNMTFGGDGIKSGTKLSEEHRKKISFSQTIDGYIKKHGVIDGTTKYYQKCENQRKSQNKRYESEYERQKCGCCGEKNGMFNKKHTELTKIKISDKLTGKKANEKTKEIFRKQRKGGNNNMYGKGHKISGEKNGKAKQWMLISPQNKKTILKGNVEKYCIDNNLSSELLWRMKNLFVQINLRKCKNVEEFKKRKNTIGWGLFEK